MDDFKGRHFEGQIILWAVQWYCKYGIRHRDFDERGVSDDHTTICRWTQRYAPEIESAYADNGAGRVQRASTKTAKRFLNKALRGLRASDLPTVINTDKAPSYGLAIAALKKEGKLSPDAQHRQFQNLNNRLEADHGKLKRLIKTTHDFQSLRTAFATLKGFEVMRALRNGRGTLFRYLPSVAGEMSLVQRAFGLAWSGHRSAA